MAAAKTTVTSRRRRAAPPSKGQTYTPRQRKQLELYGLTVDELPGWVTHKQAAAMVGLKHMAVHLAVFDRHEFAESDLAFIDLGHQPLHLIRETAVKRWFDDREKAKADALATAADRVAQREANAMLKADREVMRAQFVAMGLMRRRQRLAYVNGVLHDHEVDDWFYLDAADLATVIAAQRVWLAANPNGGGA